MVIHYCITMKIATVRDLRNNFPLIATWIAAGEEVDITSRGKIVARVSPPKPAEPWIPPTAEWMLARNKKIWAGEDREPQSEEDFQKTMDYIRAEREF